MVPLKRQGLILDMDNTILRSRIDFKQMKNEVHSLLVREGIIEANLPLHEFTASTLIEQARLSAKFTGEAEQAVWSVVTESERAGMQDAGLEPGVVELLKQLQNDFHLTILTNNAYAAAIHALRSTGIEMYFEHVIGREQAVSMKPSPAGIHQILGHYPHLSKEDWLSVGDAWIDGKAAMEAGVRFIAYQGNQTEMERRGVVPIAHIDELQQLLRYL
ncbi:HAD family hydrolase [Paenibacillus sp. CF384]|uniref:HAD family hydrolase n=1 Tax=Paenibacillus sp. CF384 TaxID=1884382 RepID=UPI000898EBA7|nr:HAD-IA family hydrolase [Paenibacillus sp. CF384]SDX61751.1 phosphoglycolate phosphatase [Paenibacillus sp. CF384]